MLLNQDSRKEQTKYFCTNENNQIKMTELELSRKQNLIFVQRKATILIYFNIKRDCLQTKSVKINKSLHFKGILKT